MRKPTTVRRQDFFLASFNGKWLQSMKLTRIKAIKFCYSHRLSCYSASGGKRHIISIRCVTRDLYRIANCVLEHAFWSPWRNKMAAKSLNLHCSFLLLLLNFLLLLLLLLLLVQLLLHRSCYHHHYYHRHRYCYHHDHDHHHNYCLIMMSLLMSSINIIIIIVVVVVVIIIIIIPGLKGIDL